jgi:hypothetical protein
MRFRSLTVATTLSGSEQIGGTQWQRVAGPRSGRYVHNHLMSSTDVTVPVYGVRNRLDRTGPAVRATLGPERREEFEAEFRTALGQADDTFDLTAVQKVIDRWWPQALLCANPDIQAGIDEDRRRIAAGDPTVFGTTTSYPHAR